MQPISMIGGKGKLVRTRVTRSIFKRNLVSSDYTPGFPRRFSRIVCISAINSLSLSSSFVGF